MPKFNSDAAIDAIAKARARPKQSLADAADAQDKADAGPIEGQSLIREAVRTGNTKASYKDAKMAQQNRDYNRNGYKLVGDKLTYKAPKK